MPFARITPSCFDTKLTHLAYNVALLFSEVYDTVHSWKQKPRGAIENLHIVAPTEEKPMVTMHNAAQPLRLYPKKTTVPSRAVIARNAVNDRLRLLSWFVFQLASFAKRPFVFHISDSGRHC